MAMEVNGTAILAAILKSPTNFGMTEAQINTVGLHTILGRLKDKTVDLALVRSIAQTIGPHDFPLSLDHLAEKELAALAKRLDPKNPALKASDQRWNRDQILKLVNRTIEPFTAAPKAAPATPKADPLKSKAPKTGVAMKSKALKPRGAAGPKTK